ncbi:MAG: glycosyltransferase family 4 protein [Gammaproteobacteria bacterium]
MTSARKTQSAGRVLILVPDLHGRGGVVNYFNTLRLHELCAVEYFYVNSADRQPLLKALWRVSTSACSLAVKLLTNRYDLVHVNPSLNPRSFFRDGLFVLLAAVSRTPTVVFFRGWDDRFASTIERSRWLRGFFRMTYGRCRNFIVLGEVFEQRLRTLGIGAARIWTETTVADARPGHDEKARAKVDAPRKEMIVLFMSRLLVSKGALIAIDAVRRYQASKPAGAAPLRLWIAGTGDDEQRVKQYVESNHLDFVEFLGHVEGAAKWSALETAHLFLFPTCYPEGMSNAVLEAMIHALPVITRDEGSMAEIVKNDVNGFVTSSTDPAVFADYLRALVADTELYRRMAIGNLDGAMRRYARAEVANRILKIYAEIRR